MLHALYFQKSINGSWKIHYNNKYVETETYNIEKQRNKPLFLPAIEGNSMAILSAYLFNWVSLLIHFIFNIFKIILLQ
jgi:carotenoid cleavage dioxygenase